MSENQDYELVPRQEVDQLKREIEELKKTGLRPGSDFVSSINKLDGTIKRLTELFDHVNKDLLRDFEQNERPEDLMGRIIQQNKIIADSILKLSEKIASLSGDIEKSKTENDSGSSFKQQNFNNQTANNELMNDYKKMGVDSRPVKKKGFFGFFKK